MGFPSFLSFLSSSVPSFLPFLFFSFLFSHSFLLPLPSSSLSLSPPPPLPSPQPHFFFLKESRTPEPKILLSFREEVTESLFTPTFIDCLLCVRHWARHWCSVGAPGFIDGSCPQITSCVGDCTVLSAVVGGSTRCQIDTGGGRYRRFSRGAHHKG